MNLNKRGAELSMNVIIITIIVVIVLVIVALFFTGGFVSLTNKISRFFGAQLTDPSTVQAKCNSYCMQYQQTTSDVLRNDYRTSFCEDKTDVDKNGDGKIDPATEKGLTCSMLGFSCSDMDC